MRLIPIDLPVSYLKSLEKCGIYIGDNRSESLRQTTRDYLIEEIIFDEKLERELEDKKITEFFNYCINCESELHNRSSKNHLFHKNIEVFVLRFCCACYRKLKDTSFDDFPTHLINNIRKKIKNYKKNMD